MDNVAYAHIGKYAENVYWDKASGLLDQMACAVGGLITIDFVEPMTPVVKKIDFDFQAQNHSLIIVQTGKGHADLSAEYSAVPEEMKKVANICKECSGTGFRRKSDQTPSGSEKICRRPCCTTCITFL